MIDGNFEVMLFVCLGSGSVVVGDAPPLDHGLVVVRRIVVLFAVVECWQALVHHVPGSFAQIDGLFPGAASVVLCFAALSLLGFLGSSSGGRLRIRDLAIFRAALRRAVVVELGGGGGCRLIGDVASLGVASTAQSLYFGVAKDGDLFVGQGPFDAVGVIAEPVIFLFFVVLLFLVIGGRLMGIMCGRIAWSEEVGFEVMDRKCREVRFMKRDHVRLFAEWSANSLHS
jgi:hypothetical protein